MIKLFLIIITLIISLILILKKKYIKKGLLNTSNIIYKEFDNRKKKIIIIKNIFKNPYEFLNTFSNYKDMKPLFDKSNYPGIRLKVPDNLKQEIINFMILINKKYYKIKGNIYNSSVTFSIMNKKDNLNIQNIIPHQDDEYYKDYSLGGLALVLYLCHPNNFFGGTKFYNLKLPIYDIDFKEKYKEYNDKLDYFHNEGNYDSDISDFFEEIYNSKIEFNKAIIYRTNYFHKADLNNLSINENLPRFTITAFLTFDTKNKKKSKEFRINNN